MRDPTIPRKNGGASGPGSNVKGSGLQATPQVGRLVDRGGDGLWLVTDRGDRWPAAFVRGVAQGSFGNRDEGVHAAPRPYRYDAAGNVVVPGDDLLVLFLEDNPKKPVILGGWRPAASSGADQSVFPAIPSSDPGPLRLRKLGGDGHLEVRALDGGATLRVEVGGGSFGTGVAIEIDYTKGKIRLTAGGSPQPAPMGPAIVDALKTLATDLLAVAAAVPVVPLPPETTTLLGELTAVTTGGTAAPFLSSLVEHD